MQFNQVSRDQTTLHAINYAALDDWPGTVLLHLRVRHVDIENGDIKVRHDEVGEFIIDESDLQEVLQDAKGTGFTRLVDRFPKILFARKDRFDAFQNLPFEDKVVAWDNDDEFYFEVVNNGAFHPLRFGEVSLDHAFVQNVNQGDNDDPFVLYTTLRDFELGKGTSLPRP